MDFVNSIAIAASGLKAQAGRIRVISENIANADSTAHDGRRRSLPAQDPDVRPAVRPRTRGADGRARPGAQATEPLPGRGYEPGNPAADANGNVKLPNVNSLVEQMDMREAQRSYEANLNVITRDAPHDRRARSTSCAPDARDLARRTHAPWPAPSPPPAPMPPRSASPARRRRGRAAGAGRRRRAAELRRSARPGARHRRPRPASSADAQAAAAVQGKADMVDVVTAVAESETALETLVAVRDRVIAAYEEIMRMPI